MDENKQENLLISPQSHDVLNNGIASIIQGNYFKLANRGKSESIRYIGKLKIKFDQLPPFQFFSSDPIKLPYVKQSRTAFKKRSISLFFFLHNHT